MKFTHKTSILTGQKWVGRKNNYIFTIRFDKPNFYCYVMKKNEFSFNTLQKKLTFETLNEAQKWCENFNKKDYEK